MMLSLSGRTYRHERLGTITMLSCAEDNGEEDCVLLERMQLQPEIDWTRLLEKARKADPPKKPAPSPLFTETFVDQHGGPWVVAVSRPKKGQHAALGGLYSVEVSPDFPGYKVELGSNRDVETVEVLRREEDWAAAAKELGLDPGGKPKKKKFGFLR